MRGGKRGRGESFFFSGGGGVGGEEGERGEDRTRGFEGAGV